jgi:hypothetical protein
MKFIIAICVAVLLCACGSKNIEGSYISTENQVRLTFLQDGTMFKTEGIGRKRMDGTIAPPVNTPKNPYKVEGDKILGNGSDIYGLRLLPNGNIMSSGWGVLVKE